jgi:hypothetical protein
MRRSKTISLADAIQDYIKEMNLGDKLREISVLDSFETIIGKAISSRISRVYIKEGVLYIYLKSSIVRNELMMIREVLKEKLNEKAGSEVIKEIVLK